MSTDATLTYYMPQGWTLRKVVTAMVQEWLLPFRAEPALKAARWVVQAVMEAGDKTAGPLWEPGISTSEYEERLDRVVRSWAIRATAGRGKGTILARLSVNQGEPGVLQLNDSQVTFPATLFNAEKVDEFLKSKGTEANDGLLAALLDQHGFRRAAQDAGEAAI